jgi:hypothetical protein
MDEEFVGWIIIASKNGNESAGQDSWSPAYLGDWIEEWTKDEDWDEDCKEYRPCERTGKVHQSQILPRMAGADRPGSE